ncbi:MAG TPA: heme-binding domain-containing protein [Flavisolibacter sp.]|nr:heme-binding domain-containing protein [Flavisolibacter sp.]
MKWGKKIATILVVGLLIIQFIRPGRNRSNKISATDIIYTCDIPSNVHQVLKTSCYDCHSNNTNYPWYANIQPFGWLLANHIQEGKKELNFSEFGSYTLRRQKSKLKGIENSIRDGSMPLGSYILMHKEALLSNKEKALLIGWSMIARNSSNFKE